MLLNPLEEMGGKLNIALTSLIYDNYSLQQNNDGKTIEGTFFPKLVFLSYVAFCLLY